MKQAYKFLVVAAVALSTSFLGSTTFAQHGHFGGGGGFHGGGGGEFHGGGGFHGGWGGGWGWRGWYPGGFSFYYAAAPYYYDPYYYYPPAYYPATTYYYAPPAVYSSSSAYVYDSPPPAPKVIDVPQQQSVDRPLSPTAVDRDSPPPPPPSLARRPAPIQRGDPGQSTSVADVKSLAKAGLSDEVILSHIRNSQAVYHLSTAEIIDLKNSGVSEKIIDFMINTASRPR